MPETIRLPHFVRGARIGSESFDPDTHQVDVVWTTGATVRRRVPGPGEFDEALEVSDRAVRLDRLNRGAPMLNSHASHELNNIVGAVVPGSARIADGKGVARVQLSRRPDAAGIVQDIRDGVIRSISVGYRIHGIEKKDRKDGVPLHRVTDWEPMEISAVPIPADTGAHVRGGRADGRTELFECRVVRVSAVENEVRRLRMRMQQRALATHILDSARTWPPLARSRGRSADDWLDVAVHEAGHAVAAIRLGRRVVAAELIERADAEYTGLTTLAPIASASDPDLLDNAIIGLAGPHAQRLLRPDGPRTAGASVDHRNVDRAADILGATAEQRRALWAFAQAEVEHLVAANRDTIEAVADVLVRTGYLTGTAVAMIVGQRLAGHRAPLRSAA